MPLDTDFTDANHIEFLGFNVFFIISNIFCRTMLKIWLSNIEKGKILGF